MSRRSYHKPVVLQVLPSLVSGGVERGTVDTAKFLTESGWVALVTSSGGPMVKDVESAGAKHFTLSLKDKNPITILINSFKLAKLIRKYKVDIVHARSRAPAWSTYLASKMTKCRFVTTFHGAYGTGRLKNYYNSVMTKGNIVIAVSDFIREHINSVYKISKHKIRTVHRGVDLKEFDIRSVDETRLIRIRNKCYIPEDKFIITLPGRLTSWKGHETLLQAVAKLNRDDIRCLLVGDTKQHEKCFRQFIRLAQKLGLSDKVTFTGPIKDMPALYMLSDLVVSPSTRPEAFGRISIEAQAMQRPIIATDIGGYKETIIDGKTGFLIPSGDSDALAEKIQFVKNLSEEKRRSMGKAARKNIESNFSLEQMKEAVMMIYKNLLKMELRDV